VHENVYTGKSAQEKINDIGEKVKEAKGTAFIT
jgi:hypothetical protein